MADTAVGNLTSYWYADVVEGRDITDYAARTIGAGRAALQARIVAKGTSRLNQQKYYTEETE